MVPKASDLATLLLALGWIGQGDIRIGASKVFANLINTQVEIVKLILYFHSDSQRGKLSCLRYGASTFLDSSTINEFKILWRVSDG